MSAVTLTAPARQQQHMRTASASVRYRENHLPACGETPWPIPVRNRKCESASLPLESDLTFDSGHAGDCETVIARRGGQFPGSAFPGELEARAPPSDNDLLHLAAIVLELTPGCSGATGFWPSPAAVRQADPYCPSFRRRSESRRSCERIASRFCGSDVAATFRLPFQ